MRSDRGAISPDARYFVFSATAYGRDQLVLRDMASSALVALAGTDGAFNPFWSPDSRSIGFFSVRSGQLRVISVVGGSIRVLADAGPAFTVAISGTWAPGVVLFGPREGRIYRVADTGGAATPLETLPLKAGQKAFVSPRFLPDGRDFTVKILDNPAVYLASLSAPGTRKILDDATAADYATGRLFYTRGGSLFARPFEQQTARVLWRGSASYRACRNVLSVRSGCNRVPARSRLSAQAYVVRSDRPPYRHTR